MSKLITEKQVKNYLKKRKIANKKIAEWKRQLPTRIGMKLLDTYRPYIFNKNGQIVYNTNKKTGKQTPRTKTITSWKEFKEHYAIIDRYKYNELKKAYDYVQNAKNNDGQDNQ